MSPGPLSHLLLLTLLPPFLSPFLLRLLYTFHLLRPSHNPSSTLKHRKLSTSLLVILYLTYTLSNSLNSQRDSALERLGIRWDPYTGGGGEELGGIFPRSYAGGGGGDVVKNSYRRLAKAYHPDKLPSPTQEQVDNWLKIQQSYALLSGDLPAQGGLNAIYAYEKFGFWIIDSASSAEAKGRPVTRGEWFWKGVKEGGGVGFWVGSFGWNVLFSVFSGGGSGSPSSNNLANTLRNIRLTLLVTFLSLELLLISLPSHLTSPSYISPPPSLLSRLLATILIFPRLLPLTFQRVAFMREVYIATSAAVGHLLPMWWGGNLEAEEEKALVEEVRKIATMTGAVELEVEKSLWRDLRPFIHVPSEDEGGLLVGREEHQFRVALSDSWEEKLRMGSLFGWIEARVRSIADGEGIWESVAKKVERDSNSLVLKVPDQEGDAVDEGLWKRKEVGLPSPSPEGSPVIKAVEVGSE